jgi:hypothetical protein
VIGKLGYSFQHVHAQFVLRKYADYISDDNDETLKPSRRFWLKATIPPNSYAQIKLPNWQDVKEVGSGTYEWETSYEQED